MANYIIEMSRICRGIYETVYQCNTCYFTLQMIKTMTLLTDGQSIFYLLTYSEYIYFATMLKISWTLRNTREMWTNKCPTTLLFTLYYITDNRRSESRTLNWELALFNLQSSNTIDTTQYTYTKARKYNQL